MSSAPIAVQPALFGLLGAAVDVRAIDGSQLGAGIGLIAAGLTLRILVTRLALIRSGLSQPEARAEASAGPRAKRRPTASTRAWCR